MANPIKEQDLAASLASMAVSTLGKIMIDADVPASTRVSAADSILEHTAKAIEMEDIEARVTDLERTAEASSGSPRADGN